MICSRGDVYIGVVPILVQLTSLYEAYINWWLLRQWLLRYILASFPGPAQLSVAFSMVKRERAWYLFSRE